MKRIVDKRVKTFLLAVEKMRNDGRSLGEIAMAMGTSETSIRVIIYIGTIATDKRKSPVFS